MRHRKLLQKARNNPKGLRFKEATALAVAFGFEFARQEGTSHRIYRHPRVPRPIPLQEQRDGKAAAYQVRQLLAAIDVYGLTMEGDDE